MSGPITQDYQQVILRRRLTKEEEMQRGNTVTEKKYTSGTNHQSSSAVDFRKLENEKVTLPYSTAQLGKSIMQARTAKGIKQSDLDKSCCFPANTVRDYENGSCIVKQDQISKMERALGVKLPRPKPQKIEN